MNIRNAKATYLIFFVLVTGSVSFLALADNDTKSEKSIFQDADQDGLSDDEEKTYGTNPNKYDTDGDGYSDGAEVRGGYDPLKPAPGDKLVGTSGTSSVDPGDAAVLGDSKDDVNLTESLSEKVTQLITNKTAEQKNLELTDLDSLAQQVVGEGGMTTELPSVDKSNIKIKTQTTPYYCSNHPKRIA